jgi:hypothetical protein
MGNEVDGVQAGLLEVKPRKSYNVFRYAPPKVLRLYYACLGPVWDRELPHLWQSVLSAMFTAEGDEEGPCFYGSWLPRIVPVPSVHKWNPAKL